MNCNEKNILLGVLSKMASGKTAEEAIDTLPCRALQKLSNYLRSIALIHGDHGTLQLLAFDQIYQVVFDKV